MVATTDVAAHAAPQLKRGVLNRFEMMGQSIANIAPTLTPALNISVVAGLAGVGSWMAYLIATIGLVFVGACISVLARRHPEAGSYFVYIGRNFGPVTGALAGWAMILAYLTTAAAVTFGVPLFLGNLLAVFHISLSFPVQTIIMILFLGCVVFAAYRDIQLSSRAALVLESVSIGIIIVITGIVIGKHGTVVDPVQLDIGKIHFGAVMSALVFGVFSFVGFESAATLAKESANPHKNVPFAVIGSAALAGTFFVILSYCMIMGMDDNASAIGGSSSPFAAMTDKAGLPWAAAVVYFAALVSGFACALACLNASSRMLYSMGRYQFLHGSMGLVHKVHKTPHMAVLASGVLTLILLLVLLPEGFLNAFGLTGTIATYGFVVVYFAVCVTAPVDAYRSGAGSPVHIILGVIGALLMGFVIYSSVVPYPEAPFNALPPVFLIYMAIGLIWFLMLKAKSPQVLASIANDMEG
ncbi:APC family permease [Acidocella sp.]|uniref:APC family permease n=1 Tax=Acidocella sp. TaxID=50710 RepID=UPI003CFEE909